MISVTRPATFAFEIGLTNEDMEHLRNGGKVVVNPKDVGLVDMEITVWFGGTHERMVEQVKNRPNADDCRYKEVESHQ